MFKHPAACLNSRRNGRRSFAPATRKQELKVSEVTTLGAMPPVPVFLHEGHATTTSRDLAEFFGKRHDDVLKGSAGNA